MKKLILKNWATIFKLNTYVLLIAVGIFLFTEIGSWTGIIAIIIYWSIVGPFLNKRKRRIGALLNLIDKNF